MEKQGVLLYTDWLWFRATGYSIVFLTILKTKLLLGLLFGVFSALILWFNFWSAQRRGTKWAPVLVDEAWEIPYQAEWALFRHKFIVFISLFLAFLVAVQAANQWELWLKYWEGVSFNRQDHLFDLDISFYVFTLPLWIYLNSWLMSLLTLSLIGIAGVYFLEGNIWASAQGLRTTRSARKHLFLLGSLILVGVAVGFYLSRYNLLYSTRGIIFGGNYADVEALLPALGILAVLALLAALSFMISAFPALGLAPSLQDVRNIAHIPYLAIMAASSEVSATSFNAGSDLSVLSMSSKAMSSNSSSLSKTLHSGIFLLSSSVQQSEGFTPSTSVSFNPF